MGVYIKNFYLVKQAYGKKTESGRHTWGPQGIRAHPRGGGALLPCGSLVGPPVVSYFCIFSNIPKWIEIFFMEFLESVYLPYHIPTSFQGSGAFQKVSFMCSSGVIV